MNSSAQVRFRVRWSNVAPVLFLVLFVSVASRAQTKGDQETPAIPKNQRVTIEFESFDKDRGSIKLRLRNSTAWDIRIPVEMNFPGKANGIEIVKSAKTHPDGAEAPVRYLTGGGALRKAESSRSVSTRPETQVSPGL